MSHSRGRTAVSVFRIQGVESIKKNNLKIYIYSGNILSELEPIDTFHPHFDHSRVRDAQGTRTEPNSHSFEGLAGLD
jgi:hypothetical protein